MSQAQHALLHLDQEKSLECAKQYLICVCHTLSKMHLGESGAVQSCHIILISSSPSPTTFKFKIQIVFVGSCFRLLGDISEHNTQRGGSLRTGFR